VYLEAVSSSRILRISYAVLTWGPLDMCNAIKVTKNIDNI